MAQVSTEFTIEEKLVSLVKLQVIDSKIDEIRIVRGELPMEVSDMEDELSGLVARKTRIEEAINGIADYINTQKENIKKAEELINKYDKQSNNVKNSREFDAINKELENQRLELKLFEQRIRNASEDLLQKTKALEVLKKTIETKQSSLSIKQEELGNIIVSTEKEEKDLLKKEGEARKNVEERLLHAYDRIRKIYKNGLAVVPIERDACGGCYQVVTPQRQAEVITPKKILACENCGRILVEESFFNKYKKK
ncbi:MAG: zinc ribbon domain-containing protein [Chitinophagaceae bacterium]